MTKPSEEIQKIIRKNVDAWVNEQKRKSVLNPEVDITGPKEKMLRTRMMMDPGLGVAAVIDWLDAKHQEKK